VHILYCGIPYYLQGVYKKYFKTTRNYIIYISDVDGRTILRWIFRKWEGVGGLDGAGSG
jgi:hypothetical protein